MLEIVDMATDVEIDVFVLTQDRIKAFLKIKTFGIALVCVGIDGMVAYDDDPVFMGRGEHGIDPGQLAGVVHSAGLRVVFAVAAVFADERGRVDHDQAEGDAVAFEHFGVVGGGHVPSSADVAVVDDGLRIAAVFVVAEDGIPGNHEFGMVVDKLIIGEPKGIGRAAYTFKMVDIAGGHDTFDVDVFGHAAHHGGYGLLIVIAVAAEVVGHDQVEGFLKGFPCCRVLGIDQASGDKDGKAD